MEYKDNDLLLLPEVASIARVPLGTVRHWTQTGLLPSFRPGRRVLVRRGDLSAFVARSRRGTP